MNGENKQLSLSVTYLCIEGVIGVGKTSLCHLIAKEFNARTVLETADMNPFLSEFYSNRKTYAFQTQLWFLLSRYRQLTSNFMQQDLFHSVTVADYIFAKDKLFASLLLDENEIALYSAVSTIIDKHIPIPDFVIYLQASTDTLLKRIRQRGRSYEHTIDRVYIEELNRSYDHFFSHYTDAPVLTINTDEMDFISRKKDFQRITNQIRNALNESRNS